MLKRNKHLFTYLMVLGFFLAQTSFVFAEYSHTHKQNAKCMVCQMADHLSHAVVSSGNLSLNIDSYAQLNSAETYTFHVSPFGLLYLIRGPPLL